MQLFILLRGRSKKRLKPVMIDSQKKCENYRQALQASDVKTWHYDIQPAPAGSTVWRKHNNYGQWTNYNSSNPPLVKNGSRG
jgi:hypothetical protein